MTRILIVGATGMLGHKMALKLTQKKYDVFATVRQSAPAFFIKNNLGSLKIIEGVDAYNPETVKEAIAQSQPDFVLNCVGIVKQLDEAKSPIPSITINALFPHQLAKMCGDAQARLIHFSTDCVFSGVKGPYKQTDPSDVNDLYGMSKFMGEVAGDKALTIRSSIIGREFAKPTGLLEWFLSQKGKEISGYKNALYTGLTTNAMVDLVDFIIQKHPKIHGIYQVSSEEISKFDLLQIVNEVYKIGVVIRADESFYCDRRLTMEEFRGKTNWIPQSWNKMIKTMFDEDSHYYITDA
tara:strand:- start:696 stop:1580 length:885 start_codon:yes stop_codon:yes gene_type:complete